MAPRAASSARWDSELADELGGDVDLIVDASDDPTTKFAVADWAVANGRCYVIAAALRYGGNVMAGAPGVACYRCLFEDPVEAPSCADAGVLGPVVGAIGGVAAARSRSVSSRGDRTHAGALFVFEDLRRGVEPRDRAVRAARRDCPACARAPISPFDGSARARRGGPLMPSIRVPSALRAFTGGNADVEVTATTVRDALAELEQPPPGDLGAGCSTTAPSSRSSGSSSAPTTSARSSGLDTKVVERDEIAIVPAIAGGSRA